MVSGLRIREKIVIPVTLLFIGAIAVTAYLSVSLVSRHLERRFEAQLEYVSEMAAQRDFALNPSILEKLKPMAGAEIITFEETGKILAGTLPADAAGNWLHLIRSLDLSNPATLQVPNLKSRDVEFEGQPFRVAYRPVRNSPGTFVALLVDTSDIVAAKRAVAKPVATVAVVMTILASLVGLLVARSITSPLQQLLVHTRRLAAGNRGSTIEVKSADEVGALALAFNEMTEQLRRTEEKYLHSEKLSVTGQLAARVAHDIRNPLSSIKIRVQLLRESVPQDHRDSLQEILQEIERVEWVVQGLLDLSRPVELHMKEASVNDVVNDVLQTSGAQLRHSKIVSTVHLDRTLPPVPHDPHRLKQALLNIVVNAMEAMSNGGTLRVTTGANEARTAITIEFEDDGVGLDPEVMDQIFDPFFTTKRDGVGLGLINTLSIVQRHGGAVVLQPRAERGTRVVVSLPLGPLTHDQAGPPKPLPRKNSAG